MRSWNSCSFSCSGWLTYERLKKPIQKLAQNIKVSAQYVINSHNITGKEKLSWYTVRQRAFLASAFQSVERAKRNELPFWIWILPGDLDLLVQEPKTRARGDVCPLWSFWCTALFNLSWEESPEPPAFGWFLSQCRRAGHDVLQLWVKPFLAELDHACRAGRAKLYSIFILHKSICNTGKENYRKSRELNGNLIKTAQSTAAVFCLPQSWTATMRHKGLIWKDIPLSSAPLLLLCNANACAGLAPKGFQPPGKICCQSSSAAFFHPDNSPYSFPATLHV